MRSSADANAVVSRVLAACDQFAETRHRLRRPDDRPQRDGRAGGDAGGLENVDHLHVETPREDALGAGPYRHQDKSATALLRSQYAIHGWLWFAFFFLGAADAGAPAQHQPINGATDDDVHRWRRQCRPTATPPSPAAGN